MSIDMFFPNKDQASELLGLVGHQNTILERMAIQQGASLPDVDWAQILELVRGGSIARDFAPGDQLVDTYTDASDATFTCPWDIMDVNKSVKRHDATEHPALFIQWHWATKEGVQFDNAEALFYTATGLPSGTYHFTIDGSWGTNLTAGAYQFTLTEDVPAGGQIVGVEKWPDVAIGTWKLYTYSGPTSTSAIENCALTSGNAGTDLGTVYANPTTAETATSVIRTVNIGGTDYTYQTNGYHRAGYGYNRWSQSAMRQWLNSSEDAGAWWIPQNVFDRPPKELSTVKGFLAGLPSALTSILHPIEVKTALNSGDAAIEGVSFDTTYDKIFLPALEQMYINPQLSGEGEYWEYYKELNGTATKYAQGSTYTDLIKYAINGHTSPQLVRLRSAGRGSGFTWIVSSSGNVGGSNAWSSYRCAPACAIH